MNEQTKVILVSEKEKEGEEWVNPLEKEIMEMKITNNLRKEISFSNTVNKFDYFQNLLEEKHKDFNKKIHQVSIKQRESVKKMKVLHKQTKEIKGSGNLFNYPKLHIQFQELRNLKQSAHKYHKLSKGMLKMLQQIDSSID